jgi:hypothetical protein
MAKILLSMPDLRRRALAESDSKPVVITFRTSPSTALQMSALKIIGRCVCCPQALLMPTRPPVRHSTSKASCDATTI